MTTSEGPAPLPEHVHCIITLFDPARAYERTIDVLREWGALGAVLHTEFIDEARGMVQAVLVTEQGRILQAGPDGIAPGMTPAELAAKLRSSLAAGVLVHSDSGEELAADVPQNIGERMTSPPEILPGPFVVMPSPDTPSESLDVGYLAGMFGSAATRVEIEGRTALVCRPIRPIAVPKELRPALALHLQPHSAAVMLWSQTGIKRRFNPVRRMQNQTRVTISAHTQSPPTYLAAGARSHRRYAPAHRDRAIAAEHALQPHFANNSHGDFAQSSMNVIPEFSDRPGAGERFAGVMTTPMGAETVPALAEIFDLPAGIIDLATGVLQAQSVDGAQHAELGAMTAALNERQARKLASRG